VAIVLECGGLPPLCYRPACWPEFGEKPRDREQARGVRAAASYRTPKSIPPREAVCGQAWRGEATARRGGPHSKSALNIPGINGELVLDMHAIYLHLHNLLVKRRCGLALEPAR